MNEYAPSALLRSLSRDQMSTLIVPGARYLVPASHFSRSPFPLPRSPLP